MKKKHRKQTFVVNVCSRLPANPNNKFSHIGVVIAEDMCLETKTALARPKSAQCPAGVNPCTTCLRRPVTDLTDVDGARSASNPVARVTLKSSHDAIWCNTRPGLFSSAFSAAVAESASVSDSGGKLKRCEYMAILKIVKSHQTIQKMPYPSQLE